MVDTHTDTARRDASAPPAARVIDCQWHWYPRAVCEAMLARTAYPRWRRNGDGYVYEASPTELWQHTRDYVDLDRQLEIMDASGIDAVVASPVLAGDVSALELGDARELCLAFNEEVARAQRKHPGRVYGVAVLPVQDAAAAIETLDDAVDRLQLVGALLHSNVNGDSIARKELWPLYAHLEARGIAVFLHPTRTFSPPRVNDYLLEPPLAYMFDTTVAAVSLIVAGVLDAFPELAIVHPHLGAALPYLVERMDVYRRLGRWDTPRTVREYLPQFYTDTVSESPAGLRLSLELYGADRVLFASDFPYFPAADGVRFVADNVPPEHAQAILSGNATQLLNLEAPVAT
jgi:aminocarboxymuconate-semialdehyde decarboxylase